jgi:hypothetical protein
MMNPCRDVGMPLTSFDGEFALQTPLGSFRASLGWSSQTLESI